MIDLRFGDRGPLVVALQLVLNEAQQSNRLAVDGKYGPDTRSAIRELQQREGLSATGDVDGRTWQALTRDLRLSVLAAADIYDPLVGHSTSPDVKGPGWIAIGGMSGGVGHVVERIAERARGLGPIVLLRFLGHGGPGSQIVSGGRGVLRDASGQEQWEWDEQKQKWKRLSAKVATGQASISNKNFAQIEAQLKSLRPLFAPFGSVVLDGCRVAAGIKGRNFLASLARVLNVPVSGGTRGQPMWDYDEAVKQSRFHPAAGLRLVGPVETAFPDGGTLQSWAQSCAQRQGQVQR